MNSQGGAYFDWAGRPAGGSGLCAPVHPLAVYTHFIWQCDFSERCMRCKTALHDDPEARLQLLGLHASSFQQQDMRQEVLAHGRMAQQRR
jgi:hypothetical protein